MADTPKPTPTPTPTPTPAPTTPPKPTPPPPRQKGDKINPLHPEAEEAAAAGVDARLAVKDEQVAARAEAEASYTPTPTQRENDLLKTGGMHIDDKERDGSGPDSLAAQQVAVEKLDNPYIATDQLHADTDRLSPKDPYQTPKKK